MQRAPLQLSEFTVALRKHVDPSSPAPLRMMAAKGVVPMAPQEMALVLYQLSFDADAKVQGAAHQTLKDTPVQHLKTALSGNVAASVLDWMATALADVVAPGGHLVTSGVLRAQQGRLRAAFARPAWRVLQARRAGTWTTTVFQRAE